MGTPAPKSRTNKKNQFHVTERKEKIHGGNTQATERSVQSRTLADSAGRGYGQQLCGTHRADPFAPQ